MDTLEEEFRPIKSLNNLYEINSNGTIFRNVKTKKESKIKLDMHHSKTGYYMVFVHIGGRRPDAYIKRVMIHRAVAECWLGDIPDGYEVDHIDRNSHNNDYHNLRYVTKSEQMKNRDHTNIAKKGSENLERARQLRAIHLEVFNKDEWIYFSSINDCMRYLAEKTKKTIHQIQYRLSIKANNIEGYTIKYLGNRAAL